MYQFIDSVYDVDSDNDEGKSFHNQLHNAFQLHRSIVNCRDK